MEREGMEDDGEILEGTSLFREESSSQVAKEASDLIVDQELLLEFADETSTPDSDQELPEIEKESSDPISDQDHLEIAEKTAEPTSEQEFPEIAEETPDFIFASDEDRAPEETHALRLLATSGNAMTDKTRLRSYCFVDVTGPDGLVKRFAKGTKASFAVERFNCQLKDPYMPVVCIVACKEGERPIEFGHDVELVLYDESWTLKTLREVVAPVQREDPLETLKDTIKEGTARALSSLNPDTEAPWAPMGLEATEAVRKASNKLGSKKAGDIDPYLQYIGVKHWEELYPGGKLPEDPLDCSPDFITKAIMMFIIFIGFAGVLCYMMEQLPDPTRHLG